MRITMLRFVMAALLVVSLTAMPSFALADKSLNTSQIRVAELYVAYLNRLPTSIESEFWIGALDNDQYTLSRVAQDLSRQSESLQLYPYLSMSDSASANAFISAIYHNLFDRDPDQPSLTFWSNSLAAGTLTVGDMVLHIIGGAGNNATDRQTLDSRLAEKNSGVVRKAS